MHFPPAAHFSFTPFLAREREKCPALVVLRSEAPALKGAREAARGPTRVGRGEKATGGRLAVWLGSADGEPASIG